ncbi:germin-like protein 1-1 [Selaginella moellendorffii]|uniref:germin-like protein 1-1 n=1 Tax=Selaginella moellendorffii TaxID=88036 RepID=UPI000D1C6A0E|nr:germin-like protein 1-1 [Selaginella moellendorffii]|eukprot:XP_024536682.1 germin-like protein 1-1 [Selaginella moellendorffii]
MLQEVCVADNNSTITINGKVCKPMAAEDFKLGLLRNPGNTGNRLGSAVTAANVANFPELNTLDISFLWSHLCSLTTHPAVSIPHTSPSSSSSSRELSMLASSALRADHVFRRAVRVPPGMFHFQINVPRAATPFWEKG